MAISFLAFLCSKEGKVENLPIDQILSGFLKAVQFLPAEDFSGLTVRSRVSK